jgi:hypothetical protein
MKQTTNLVHLYTPLLATMPPRKRSGKSGKSGYGGKPKAPAPQTGRVKKIEKYQDTLEEGGVDDCE